MRQLNKRGMTLIEVVVAIAIFGIVMVTIFPAVLVLNLMNTYSFEKLDTTFIAQQEIETVIFQSTNQSFNNVRDYIINTLGYTEVQTSPSYMFSKSESNYVITLSLTRSGNSNIYQLLVLVISNTTDIAGNRSQLETIISLN